jgi:cytoskeletal protein CcmA (bactofilin family)
MSVPPVQPVQNEPAQGESPTVSPLYEQNQPQQPDFFAPQSEPTSTPVADAFFSGGGVPVSLFGGQPTQQVQSTEPQPVREAAPNPAPAFSQNMNQSQQFGQNPYQNPYQQTQYQQNPYQNPYQQTPPSSVPTYPNVAAPSSAQRSRGFGEDSELTIISRNTVIDGNIRSFADMSVDGDIQGDVETTKDIDLNGKIVGNLTCNNAMMHTAQVQGNVRMKGNISMKRDTLLIGDLMSTYAEVNGKVKGNLDVVGKADLKGDAVVFGDISASTITVEDGAIIQGYVSTTFLNKEESKNLFPDTVTIGKTETAGL